MGHYFLFLSVLRHLICLPFLGVSNLFSSISGHFHLLPFDFLHHQLQSIAHLIVHLLGHLLPTSCLSTHPPYYHSRSYAGPSLFPTSTINQSINVYSFQQPHMIFQEKKAFTVAKLIISQASKSVNMHRNDKLSCVGWCDKLGILSTTDVEMVP